jgi:hypothetical protein
MDLRAPYIHAEHTVFCVIILPSPTKEEVYIALVTPLTTVHAFIIAALKSVERIETLVVPIRSIWSWASTGS